MEENSSNLFETTQISAPATTGQRLANYIIDVIIFYVLCFVLGFIIASIIPSLFGYGGSTTFASYLIAIVVIVSYYTLLEGSTGKSVGKIVTGTKVITENGDKTTYKDAFIRSVSRLVPFEPLSIFFGNSGMWHDRWSHTRVVKK
ncbi:MAG: RDD family protein [Niabella sp.]